MSSGNSSGYRIFASHRRPISRLTQGGKSTQPNGSLGERCTRPSRTALTGAQAGSLRTLAAKSWSMVMMTSGFHSSTCSIETLASPPRVRAGDVLRQQLDRLDVDRAAEPGLQPARAARVVDARAPLGRDCADALRDRPHHVFGGAREGLALLGPADQRAERTIGLRDAVEAAVEQRIGNAGLLLHAVGERDVGRADAADVEDEVGLEREHDLEIGGVAAPGDAADLRPAADVGQQELALLRRLARGQPSSSSGASV